MRKIPRFRSCLRLLLLIAFAMLTGCDEEGPNSDGFFVHRLGKVYWWEYDTDGGKNIIFERKGENWFPVTDSQLNSEITAVAVSSPSFNPGGANAPYSGPARAATATSPRYAYLLDFYAELFKFDLDAHKVAGKLDFSKSTNNAFGQRMDVTLDARRAFMTVSGPGTSAVVVADLVNFSIISIIKLPADSFAGGVAITPDGKLAYVVTRPASVTGPSNIVVFDVATLQIVNTIPIPGYSELYHIAMTPDGTEAYLANYITGGFSIPVINLVTNTLEPSMPIFPSYTAGYVAMHPDGTRLYLVPLAGGKITIMSTITKSLAGTISLPAPGTQTASLASDPTFTPDGSGLIVQNGAAMLAVINTTKDTVDSTIAVPPSRAAVTRHSGFLFVPDP